MQSIYYAPERPSFHAPSVFLAGSIEIGKAQNWQTGFAEGLEETLLIDHVILNPRRNDWDSSWVQDISNPQFREQVAWELAMLEKADVIAMHFEPGTKSPISLLELGLHAKSGKMVVSCPDEFWRRGNVEIVCRKYGIEFVDNIEEMFWRVKGCLEVCF